MFCSVSYNLFLESVVTHRLYRSISDTTKFPVPFCVSKGRENGAGVPRAETRSNRQSLILVEN